MKRKLVALDDTVLLKIISWLTVSEIATVQKVCKKLYTLGKHDDLWRQIFLDNLVDSTDFETWKNSDYDLKRIGI